MNGAEIVQKNKAGAQFPTPDESESQLLAVQSTSE